MKYTSLLLNNYSVSICFSSFEHEKSSEYHAIFEGVDPLLDAETQYRNIEDALRCFSKKILPRAAVPVFKRWFSSDAVNHQSFILKEESAPVAVSIVHQPPLNGVKAALWVYFVENATVSQTETQTVVMERSAYRHLFDTQLHSRTGDEASQTDAVFQEYASRLSRQNCTLASNVIRTWIYVKDVDSRYAGMVKVRRQYFTDHGLTPDTHYIASTGIEGRYIYPETLVLMDAYAIDGVNAQQISYLKGASHLNPTHRYGVTFERATAVDYGDRRHVFVSGTASIDNSGQIVHPLDVMKQTERMMENVSVLLREGGATANNIAQMIIYLRDMADYRTVSAYFDAAYPDIPKVTVHAPVCRPGWLIEVECIAVCEAENEGVAVF